MITPTDIQGLGLTMPPTQDELPYDDGIPMESQRHNLQMTLLIEALYPWMEQRDDGYVGGNMFIYFSLEQVRNKDFRGPDCFVVLDVPKGERKSWVCWEEGKSPDVVIELLSDSTITIDKTEKKQIYETRLRVPEYYWYDPFNPEDRAGFRLDAGHYLDIPRNVQGGLASHKLGLLLVLWDGSFAGVETRWLRWAYPDGTLLLTPAESAQQQADQERQRADQAEAQVIQVALNLLQTGMAVDQVGQITGLPESQVEHLRQTLDSSPGQ